MNDLSPAPVTKNATQLDRFAWGVIELQVTDLGRAVEFWTSALGLIERERSASKVALGTKAKTLFVLHAGATKPVRPQFTGMYHVAIGVRSQVEFSRILARLIHLNVRVSPTDHLMAKSLYLIDPDGLEIEITFETPERFGSFGDISAGLVLYDSEGRPHNGRSPLDVGAELVHAEGADALLPLANDTYLAHLHFKVPALEPALDWYESLGFSRHLTLESWGFADMGAGIENTHRLAMNIWAGPNLSPAPKDMARLVHYELIALDMSVPESVPTLKKDGEFLRGKDPSGVDFKIRSSQSSKGDLI